MKMRKRASWTLRVGLTLVLSGCAGFLEAAEISRGPAEQALARKILDATGIKGGLVVHLGIGDGKLTAALRASDSYIVQGLERDAANVERARRHIHSLGLYGPVSVDRLHGTRLPYIDNLINLS